MPVEVSVLNIRPRRSWERSADDTHADEPTESEDDRAVPFELPHPPPPHPFQVITGAMTTGAHPGRAARAFGETTQTDIVQAEEIPPLPSSAW